MAQRQLAAGEEVIIDQIKEVDQIRGEVEESDDSKEKSHGKETSGQKVNDQCIFLANDKASEEIEDGQGKKLRQQQQRESIRGQMIKDISSEDIALVAGVEAFCKPGGNHVADNESWDQCKPGEHQRPGQSEAARENCEHARKVADK